MLRCRSHAPHSGGRPSRRLMARKSLAAAVVCTLGATPAAFATDIYGVQLALNGGAPPQINAILIPGGATNPNYGDWESAFYRYNYGLTPAQKDSAIRATLRSF